MKMHPVARAVLAAAVAAIPSVGLAIDIPTITLDQGIAISSVQRSSFQIGAYPVTPSVPINGFSPMVAMTLTDQQSSDDFTWTAISSSSVIGNSMPSTGPHYAMAIMDSGGQTHLISYDDAGTSGFDIANSNRVGGYTAQLAGASGVEFADISDPVGVFATGFGNVTSGTTPTVNTSTLKGQYNVSVLSAQTGSALPNICGLPMYAQYGVSIRNSETYTKTVAGKSYKSPNVTLTSQNPATGTGYIAGLNHKVSLDLLDPNSSATSAPAYFPSFDNFNNLRDNPSTPTFWAYPFATVNFSHKSGSQTGQQFLFDTGAQVSVLSEQMAANVGFDVATDTPDFTVEVAGVGGTTTQVPGFYLQSFSIPAVGGTLSLTNVPVLVLNVVDPRDGVGFVPGIVGMNLFNNRDLFLNLNTTDPYVRWGEAMDAKWKVNSNGNWSTDTNWLLGVPNAVDDPANFTDAIGAAHTVTVDIPVKVGSMTFNNAAKYTIAGSQTITVESSLTGSITDTAGSHDITAPVAINSDTLISIAAAGDKLKFTQLQSSSKTLTKSGAGTLEVNAVRANGLNINAGTVEITANGAASGVSVIKSLTIAAGSRLDLHNNDLIFDYTASTSPYATLLAKMKSGLTLLGGNGSGIGSSEVDSQSLPGTLLAIVDNGAIGGQVTSLSGYNGVPADSVIIKYTWMGDSNFDGKVDGSDYALVDSGFTSGGSLGGWVFGDYNYDGKVDGSDYAIIDTGFIQSNAILPEPASISMLGIGAIALLRRRTR